MPLRHSLWILINLQTILGGEFSRRQKPQGIIVGAAHTTTGDDAHDREYHAYQSREPLAADVLRLRLPRQ